VSARKPRTIDEFAKAKQRALCPVCRLRPTILAQITVARKQRYTMPVILAWLKSEFGITLTTEQMRHHYGAMHEGKAGLREQT